MPQPDISEIEDCLPKHIKIIRLKAVSLIEISQSSLKVMKMALHSSPEPTQLHFQLSRMHMDVCCLFDIFNNLE
jgi:hypothetical protein